MDPSAMKRDESKTIKPFAQKVRLLLKRVKRPIGEAVMASVFINFITAIVSFFSLQVYDKVIPTRSLDTLVVMLMGVVMLIAFEWVMKWSRSKVMDRAVLGVDHALSKDIYTRLLHVRLDALPKSVGSLAAQLKGYEAIRTFLTAATLYALVDIPAAMLFIVLIAVVGSPWVAAVPLLMGSVTLMVGWMYRQKILDQANTHLRESNMKMGLLVETLEGAETIKASGGGEQFLNKWIAITRATIKNEMDIRHTHEGLSYFLASAQQLSYVLLVSVGAFLVVQGEITMGALIACSIMGGRVLGAVMFLPNLMSQQANAMSASDGIESLYQLKVDNEGVDQPMQPSQIKGQYNIEAVEFAYPGCPNTVTVDQLTIQAGEKVGILGPIGSGKSTLLKIMAGLYAPQRGRVRVDGLEMSQIDRSAISQHLAYMQQDHRLFQGSLRENLLIGLNGVSDDALKEAMEATGLLSMVANHPRGLDLPIHEGGQGLSGGQKQLVALTRMLLSRPKVMLLDEPTASMDDAREDQCIHALKKVSEDGSTLVLVTHKPALLCLVDRLIVVAQGRIVMDGPKQDVMNRLQGKPVPKAPQIVSVTSVKLNPSEKAGT
jgi:ATP-binding cassette subfamily C protein LapB